MGQQRGRRLCNEHFLRGSEGSLIKVSSSRPADKNTRLFMAGRTVNYIINTVCCIKVVSFYFSAELG